MGTFLRYVVAGALMTAPVLAAPDSSTGPLANFHQEKGLACAACHTESPPKFPVADHVCIACHGGVAAIVDRTHSYEANPHVSPHSAELQCSTCHHAHKPSEVSCLACHPGMQFVKKTTQP